MTMIRAHERLAACDWIESAVQSRFTSWSCDLLVNAQLPDCPPNPREEPGALAAVAGNMHFELGDHGGGMLSMEYLETARSLHHLRSRDGRMTIGCRSDDRFCRCQDQRSNRRMSPATLAAERITAPHCSTYRLNSSRCNGTSSSTTIRSWSFLRVGCQRKGRHDQAHRSAFEPTRDPRCRSQQAVGS